VRPSGTGFSLSSSHLFAQLAQVVAGLSADGVEQKGVSRSATTTHQHADRVTYKSSRLGSGVKHRISVKAMKR